MLQICQNIKKIRKLKGFTQDTMAQKLAVTRSTYRNWEEETEPDLATIKTIARVLDVPAWTLLEGIIEFEANKKPGTKPGKQSLPINSDAGVQNPSIDAATLETLVVFLLRIRKGEYDDVNSEEVVELFWREHTARLLDLAKNIQTGKRKRGKGKSVDSSVDS